MLGRLIFFSWTLWGRIYSILLSRSVVAASSPWCSLAYGCITPISTSVFTPPSFLRASVFSSVSYKEKWHWIHPNYICKDTLSKSSWKCGLGIQEKACVVGCYVSGSQWRTLVGIYIFVLFLTGSVLGCMIDFGQCGIKKYDESLMSSCTLGLSSWNTTLWNPATTLEGRTTCPTGERSYMKKTWRMRHYMERGLLEALGMCKRPCWTSQCSPTACWTQPHEWLLLIPSRTEELLVNLQNCEKF